MSEKLLRPGEAATLLGVSLMTLRRWEADGSLRVVRTPHGSRRIPLSEVQRLQGTKPAHSRVVCVYARVSSHDQKAKGDLDRQVAHLERHLPEGEATRVLVITDVASGRSDKRKGLSRLMELAARGEVTDIVITYKDRLTGFGFGYLERYFAGS
ncbi:MAG: IS607 family transposase [Thermaerobacter sp.]|nr:IS607 family transposase [Thermaerobacter sp.]